MIVLLSFNSIVYSAHPGKPDPRYKAIPGGPSITEIHALPAHIPSLPLVNIEIAPDSFNKAVQDEIGDRVFKDSIERYNAEKQYYLFKPTELDALKFLIFPVTQLLGKPYGEKGGKAGYLELTNAGWNFSESNVFQRGEIVLLRRSDETHTYGIVVITINWGDFNNQILVQVNDGLSKPVQRSWVGKLIRIMARPV